MPADKKIMENFLSNGDTNEHERISILIRAIRTEMKDMAQNEIERLYAAIALMEKKKICKKNLPTIDGLQKHDPY